MGIYPIIGLMSLSPYHREHPWEFGLTGVPVTVLDWSRTFRTLVLITSAKRNVLQVSPKTGANNCQSPWASFHFFKASLKCDKHMTNMMHQMAKRIELKPPFYFQLRCAFQIGAILNCDHTGRRKFTQGDFCCSRVTDLGPFTMDIWSWCNGNFFHLYWAHL